MENLAIIGPHIVVGSLTLSLYWAALLTRKGSPSHRRNGRRYLLMLLPLLATVVPITWIAARLDGPARVAQLLFLTLVLCTAGWTAWRAVRDRRDPGQFRGPVFRCLAVMMLVAGLALMVLGIVTRNVLTFGFAMIGIVYGGAMLGFLGQPAYSHWWLDWHLNGISLLFAATHASFVGLVAGWLWPDHAGETMHALSQLGTIAAAYCLRLWLGYRFLPAAHSPGLGRPRSIAGI